ncbi:hypothetical protein D3C86_1201370 [compost metagenome]
MLGQGTNSRYQTTIGFGKTHARAGGAGADSSLGLQREQRLGIAVVGAVGRRHGNIETVTGSRAAADGHRHIERFGVATGIGVRHGNVQVVVLAGHDAAGADTGALGVEHFIGGSAGHQHANRHRSLDRRLHFQALHRIVNIQSSFQTRLAHRTGAVIARGLGGRQRSGRGQGLGVGHDRGHVGGGATGRGDLERIAGGHGARIDAQAEAIDDRISGRRCSECKVAHVGVIRQATHVVARRGNGHLIITGRQLAGVLDGDIQVAGCRVVASVGDAALADGFQAVDVVEQRRAEVAVLIQALAQLLVDLIGHDHGDTTQAIDRRCKHFIAITHQAAHLATAHHAGDVD